MVSTDQHESKTVLRGGKICLTSHFKPLWAKNVPRFGVAHAMAMGVCLLLSFYSLIGTQLAPWLAAEVPHMASRGRHARRPHFIVTLLGVIQPKESLSSPNETS